MKALKIEVLLIRKLSFEPLFAGWQGKFMKTTRREFGKVALGTAIGAMSGTTLLNNKAQAQTRKAHAAGVYHDGVMQLNQNESARGPGPKTL